VTQPSRAVATSTPTSSTPSSDNNTTGPSTPPTAATPAAAPAPKAPAPSGSLLLSSAAKTQAELLPIEKVDRMLTGPGGPFEISYELIDGRIQPIFAAQKVTLRDAIFNTMKTHPRRTHVVYGDVRLTYADTYAESMLLAKALRYEWNVRKGDRIAIISRNTPHFALTAFAAFILGAIIVPINAFAEAPTLAFCIQDADARVVVCDVERWDRLQGDGAVGGGIAGLALKSKSLQGFIVSPWKMDEYVGREKRSWLKEADAVKQALPSSRGPVTVTDWDDLVERAAAYPNLPLPHLTPGDNAMILYTSGTTGLPKGVLSNHRQVLGVVGIGGVHLTRAFLRRGQMPPTPPGPEVWDEDSCGSALTLSPLFHVTGLASGLLAATFRGGRIVFLPAYSPQRAIDTIRRERVKLVSGIGFMVREILRAAKPEDLVSLEGVSHGGSSAANEIPAESQERKRGLASANGYGMSETNGLVLGSYLDEYMQDPSSIGHPVPSVDIRILDPETGRVLEDGKPGELLIRSPCNATGYWRRPEATRETFLADGFIRRGDLARREPNGYVYIMDRIKEIIIRGGENVSCATVEGAIYSDPRVLECAAIGVPDERLGERVGIIVVVSPSTATSTLDTHAVQEIGRAKGLPKFAIPDVVWIRTEALGKNANGKVVKRQLKEEMKRWMASSSRDSKL